MRRRKGKMQTFYEARTSRAVVRPGPVWWLIVHDGDGPLEPLTIACSGQQALPVFSFAEEAEMFCRLAAFGGRWRVRASSCGELVSLLHGPCAAARAVVLDALPEMVADGTVDLVSLDRDLFMQRLLRAGGTRWP